MMMIDDDDFIIQHLMKMMMIDDDDDFIIQHFFMSYTFDKIYHFSLKLLTG